METGNGGDIHLGDSMNTSKAAELIEVMAASLRADPHQFQILINVTGQSVTSNGGTGMSISVSGGGPGSTTIGNKVSLSGAQIEISQQRGVQAMNEQFEALLLKLGEICQELKKPTPDKTMVKQAIDSLRNTWVPGVIIGVLGNVASNALGV